MNINFLLPIIRNLVPKQRLQAFDSTVNSIREYSKTHKINSIQDAMQAMADFNVPKDFLSKFGPLNNNPIVSTAARICGIDTGKIEEDMQQLSGISNSLDQYQRELKNIK